MNTNKNIGIVGATGVVGETFLNLLKERQFPVGNLKLFASESSKGKKILFNEKEYIVETLSEKCFEGLDLVFFSSGDHISKEWAPKAVSQGAFAVDNSAAFRMDIDTVLCVPEINLKEVCTKTPKVIANPNCSTIQLVVALSPLKQFGLKNVRVSSYQAVSGAGKAGKKELLTQTSKVLSDINKNSQEQSLIKGDVFSTQIAFNAIPEIGSLKDNGYCSEELKIINETKKILSMPELLISAFTVRIPAINVHSEAVWFELDQDVDLASLESTISEGRGIVFSKSPKYHTAVEVNNQDPVHVSKLRKDISFKNSWQMWVVADNLKKGAALNGIQIAEGIFDI